jgi:hypothetical protein
MSSVNEQLYPGLRNDSPLKSLTIDEVCNRILQLRNDSDTTHLDARTAQTIVAQKYPFLDRSDSVDITDDEIRTLYLRGLNAAQVQNNRR